MILQRIKKEKIKERIFKLDDALTGNLFHKVIFTGREINELSQLSPLALKNFINHLETRASLNTSEGRDDQKN